MKSLELQNRLKRLEQQTYTALFSYNQAKILFADENEETMYAALCRHTKNGVIERVCKGIWINPLNFPLTGTVEILKTKCVDIYHEKKSKKPLSRIISCHTLPKQLTHY